MIWGIFLTWFADSLLFDMMIKTSYRDGVNTLQDFLDRNMFLGHIGWWINDISEIIIIYSNVATQFCDVGENKNLRLP